VYGSTPVGTLSHNRTAALMAQVSVVIPCFNYGRFLAGAIETLVGQCDGGEFVVFLDADDERTSSAVETSVRCLGERPDCACVYGHQRSIDTSGAVITAEWQAGVKRDSRVQSCVEVDPYAVILRSGPIRAPGVVFYRSESVKAVGGLAGGLWVPRRISTSISGSPASTRFAVTTESCSSSASMMKTRPRFHDENATRTLWPPRHAPWLGQGRSCATCRRAGHLSGRSHVLWPLQGRAMSRARSAPNPYLIQPGHADE